MSSLKLSLKCCNYAYLVSGIMKGLFWPFFLAPITQKLSPEANWTEFTMADDNVVLAQLPSGPNCWIFVLSVG